MANEADTCRKWVVPKLQAAGWDNEPHSIAEQRTFTDGRIVVRGNQTQRQKPKRADYLLRYTRDFPIAVTEAKAAYKKAADGLQQAKDYAEILGLKFAYATNGKEIIEFDFITGIERTIANFPTPAELWARLCGAEKLSDDAASHLLTLSNLTTGKEPRYYQRIAIDRAVQSIVQGKKRVLLTMATGTGKTVVAFQICWKLWSSKWNAKGDPTRKPRILYLADRNFLVDDPKDKTFSVFGDARHKIEGGIVTHGRELYFSTYQSIAKDERRPGLYKQFAPDFFDLIIVDECHRGSAREESNWREILEYFAPAYQLGMTATPLREENKDTYLYFGNPIYTYSLKQGIDDGFLAPYRVHRIVTQWDAAGWRPSKADLDRYGREIPDEVYTTGDFERRVALRARTQAVARHLTDFLRKTDRFAKTIVFCVDQEHASEMRTALNNLNSDLVGSAGVPPAPPGVAPGGSNTPSGPYPDYVCRVTADEGDIGRGHMQRFQDVETRTPVILTTSQLLTTGLDAPTCRNVVLLRLVNSMVEFKQIIGRGTRVRDDYGKLWFNILDYTGTATRNFADPAFDGDPAFATHEEIDEHGRMIRTEVLTTEEPEDGDGELREQATGGNLIDPLSASIGERDGVRCRKFYFDGGQVEIAAELVHELDADGKQLRVVKLTDYTAEKVRTLCASPDELRARWADAGQRADIIHQLGERGIDFAAVAAQAGQPDADPFDLLCHPQGVRRVRRALSVLASKGFQVVFSTHSPLMLDRANAAHTVIVRKEPATGARARKPLQQAVRDALSKAESQSRVLFELGNIAEIYFAERVVLCEGKTDRQILPLAYEQLNGRAPELDHVAFVSIGSCADIRKALAVLRAMEIPACAIADLDFAFTEAAKGNNSIVAKDGAEISKAKAILKRIQPAHGFSLAANGLPENKNGFRAADTWALLAADAEGRSLASSVHLLLKTHGVWVWATGAIEHIIGTADKGEDAIIAQEELLRTKSSKDVAAEFPAIVDCFKWIKSFDKPAQADAQP